jgi:hypothetical protein
MGSRANQMHLAFEKSNQAAPNASQLKQSEASLRFSDTDLPQRASLCLQEQ